MSCSRSPPILASSRPVPGEALCHWYRNPSKPVPTNESASRQSSYKYRYKYRYNHAHSSLSLSRVAVIFHFSVVASSIRAEPASLSVAGAICMSMRSCSFAARSMVDAQPQRLVDRGLFSSLSPKMSWTDQMKEYLLRRARIQYTARYMSSYLTRPGPIIAASRSRPRGRPDAFPD